MIKLIVAYVDADVFEAIRHELHEKGITSMSAGVAGGVSDDRFVAAHFRGTPQTLTLAEKLRLECVVGESHVESVKETIFNHVGRRSFVFVQAVEQAWPVDTVHMD